MEIYFLIPSVIAKIFITTTELIIQIGTQTNKANPKIETYPVIVEARTSKCSLNTYIFHFH